MKIRIRNTTNKKKETLQNRRQTDISILPNELIIVIASLLSKENLLPITLVCKNWAHALTHNFTLKELPTKILFNQNNMLIGATLLKMFGNFYFYPAHTTNDNYYDTDDFIEITEDSNINATLSLGTKQITLGTKQIKNKFNFQIAMKNIGRNDKANIQTLFCLEKSQEGDEDFDYHLLKYKIFNAITPIDTKQLMTSFINEKLISQKNSEIIIYGKTKEIIYNFVSDKAAYAFKNILCFFIKNSLHGIAIEKNKLFDKLHSFTKNLDYNELISITKAIHRFSNDAYLDFPVKLQSIISGFHYLDIKKHINSQNLTIQEISEQQPETIDLIKPIKSLFINHRCFYSFYNELELHFKYKKQNIFQFANNHLELLSKTMGTYSNIEKLHFHFFDYDYGDSSRKNLNYALFSTLLASLNLKQIKTMTFDSPYCFLHRKPKFLSEQTEKNISALRLKQLIIKNDATDSADFGSDQFKSFMYFFNLFDLSEMHAFAFTGFHIHKEDFVDFSPMLNKLFAEGKKIKNLALNFGFDIKTAFQLLKNQLFILHLDKLIIEFNRYFDLKDHKEKLIDLNNEINKKHHKLKLIIKNKYNRGSNKSIFDKITTVNLAGHVARDIAVKFCGKFANPKLYSTSTCVLPISVGQKYHENEQIIHAIKFAKANFNRVVIVVADTLQKYTIKRDPKKKYEDEDLRAICLSNGAEWLMRNKSALSILCHSKDKIYHWDEFLGHDEYLKTKKCIENLYQRDKFFQKAIDDTVKKYAARYSRGKNKSDAFDINSPKAINSRKYLFEECAVLLLWIIYKFHFIAYPRQLNEPMYYLIKHFAHTKKENLRYLNPLRIDIKKVKNKTNSNNINLTNFLEYKDKQDLENKIPSLFVLPNNNKDMQIKNLYDTLSFTIQTTFKTLPNHARLMLLKSLIFRYNKNISLSNMPNIQKGSISARKQNAPPLLVQFYGRFANPKIYSKSTCLIPITVGQKYHEAEKIYAIINYAKNTFANVTIVIADTLQRHIIQQASPMQITKKDGIKWRTRNKTALNLLQKDWDSILHWKIFLEHTGYSKCLQTVKKLFQNDIAFNSAVNQAVTKQIRSYNKGLNTKPKKQKNNEKYFIEKCAVLLLWAHHYKFHFMACHRNPSQPMFQVMQKLIHNQKETENLLKPLIIDFRKNKLDYQTKSKNITIKNKQNIYLANKIKGFYSTPNNPKNTNTAQLLVIQNNFIRLPLYLQHQLLTILINYVKKTHRTRSANNKHLALVPAKHTKCRQ